MADSCRAEEVLHSIESCGVNVRGSPQALADVDVALGALCVLLAGGAGALIGQGRGLLGVEEEVASHALAVGVVVVLEAALGGDGGEKIRTTSDLGVQEKFSLGLRELADFCFVGGGGEAGRELALKLVRFPRGLRQLLEVDVEVTGVRGAEELRGLVNGLCRRL